MQPFYRLAVIAAVVTSATAEYDWMFCSKYMDSEKPATGKGLRPTFYDNFNVFLEMKNIINKTVIYITEDYSKGVDQAHFRVNEAAVQVQLWVDAKTDEELVGPTSGSKCTDAKLSGSTFADDLGVSKDATGDVQLSTPEVALGWHEKYQRNSSYLGHDSIRGITVDKWLVCSYNPVTGITLVTYWYTVNPANFHLPVVPLVMKNKNDKIALPVSAHAFGLNKTNPLVVQYIDTSIEFTFYDTIDPNGTAFKIPSDMICAAKPSQQISMPAVPTYFQFKGEEMIILNPNSQSPDAPVFVYTVEKYMYQQKIFVRDTLSKPSGRKMDNMFLRVVNDYNIGFTFNINVMAGTCSGIAIDPNNNPDAIRVAGGLVQMRSYQQFFDIDSNQYQYMGINLKRGISCDTYSARFNDSNPNHIQNALYTWYFANPQWMKQYQFKNWTNPLPVALEILEDERYTQMNFFEYDTQDDIRIPDLSFCMHPEFTLNIQFYISAPFANVTALTTSSVNRGLYSALISQTSLNTLLRVSNFDIEPAGTVTSVKFKLFDLRYVHATGDVKGFNYGSTNAQIYEELSNRIKTYSFSIAIFGPSDTTTPTTFQVQADSLKLLKENAAPKSSSGYSGGSMAGIAFGMLFLGVLLSVVIIFGVIKVKQIRGQSAPDLAKLDHESET
jgi:hypothetical protein